MFNYFSTENPLGLFQKLCTYTGWLYQTHAINRLSVSLRERILYEVIA
jgi:hypothetical protein